jgi:uncharacterized membrane protein
MASVISMNYNSIMLSKIIDRLIIAIFINNRWLGKVTHCHQLSTRSFFWKGRQFHVCARCTGIIIGIVFSPLIFLLQMDILIFFSVSLLILGVDGITQLWKWRESNNTLRFITGFTFGLTFLPSILLVMAHLVQELH